MSTADETIAANWSTALQWLTPAELDQVNRYLIRRSHAARHRIFNQGEPAQSFYVIVSGRVRIIHTTESGAEFTTGIWADDYIIGLVSAYLGVRRSLTAESLDPVELLMLPQSALHTLLDTIPQFARNITRILAAQAYDSMRRSGLVVLQPAAINLRRIMARLAMQDDASPDGHAREIRGLTQEDLASMVGVSRTWLNQTLASFERSGLIRRHRNGITITDIRTFAAPPGDDLTSG